MQLLKFRFISIFNNLLKISVVPIVLLIGCHADDYPEIPPTRVIVTGTVIDADTDLPIEGASVRSDNNAVTFITKANGLFALEDVPVNKIGEVIITFSKDGYPSNQKVFVVENGRTYSTQLKLKPYGDIKHVEDIAASKEVVIDPKVKTIIEIPGDQIDAANPDAVLVFPENSLDSGTNGERTYTIKAIVLDPTDNEIDRTIFPGFFLSAPFDFFRPDALLESAVFVHVSITDDKGAQITSLLKPVQLYLKLPTTLQSDYVDGNTIKWWSFRNTRGHWGQEASNAIIVKSIGDYPSATLLYVKADVSQLNWYSAGPNITRLACLGVTVEDQDGAPVSGAVVIAQGVTYQGNSLPVLTNNNGFAQVLVKPSIDDNPDNSEKVQVLINQGPLSKALVVTDPDDGELDKPDVTTPTTGNSFIIKNGVEYGDCKILKSKFTVDVSGNISGLLTYLGTGTPVANHAVHTDIGYSVKSDENGIYTIDTPPVLQETFYLFASVEHPVRPFFDGVSSIKENVNLTVQNPVIDTLTQSPLGTVTEGTDATLTVTAKDLEDPSRTLIYSWTADKGTFVDNTLESVVWTAPADTGTANIDVVVDNGSGGSITQSIQIDYATATP